jgi:hypothetical protein
MRVRKILEAAKFSTGSRLAASHEVNTFHWLAVSFRLTLSGSLYLLRPS